MSDQRRPPPPVPPPRPTVRVPTDHVESDPHIRAAGLARPRASSDPRIMAEANRRIEDHQLQRFAEHEAKTGQDFAAAKLHVQRLERAMSENDDAQNAALVILARELGVAHKLPPKIRGSMPPPPMGSAPPKPVLPTIERDSWQAKALAVALIFLQLALEVFRRFYGGH